MEVEVNEIQNFVTNVAVVTPYKNVAKGGKTIFTPARNGVKIVPLWDGAPEITIWCATGDPVPQQK
jgi:hypothetical protein